MVEDKKKQEVTKKTKETEIINKLDDIAQSLNNYTVHTRYTDNDLDKLYNEVKDIRVQLENLDDKYHTLDKNNVDFLSRLKALEKAISEFKESETVDEDRVKSAVQAFLSLLLGGVVTYVFSQLKHW